MSFSEHKPDSRPRFSLKAVSSFSMGRILGGAAATAVVGTFAHAIWKGPIGLFLVRLYVLFPYLALPYPILYLLAPTEETGMIASIDRVFAKLTALGLLVPWGWYVTVPPAPQNAQAPIGLFMMGFGIVGFYVMVKVCIHAFRMWSE